MSPIELAQGSFPNNHHMKILLVLCALSVLVMHFNQDLSAMYWIGFIGFIITGFSIANRLDNGRTSKDNKEHLR
jgi:hypothetical protein